MTKKEAQMDMSESAKKERQFLARQETIQKEHKRKNSLPFRILNRFRSRPQSRGEGDGQAKIDNPTHDSSAPRSSEHEDPETAIPPQGRR